MSTTDLARVRAHPFSRLRPRAIGSRRVAYIALFLIVANLVLVPLAMVVATSVNLGPITGETKGFTLENYVRAWTSPVTWSVLGNTIIFATSATVIAMAIGVFFAFMVE